MNGGQSTIHGAGGLLSSSYSGEVLGIDSGRLPRAYGFSSSVYVKPPRDYNSTNISIISQVRSYENSRFTVICVAISRKLFASRKGFRFYFDGGQSCSSPGSSRKLALSSLLCS
jgi:hypothetical protein